MTDSITPTLDPLTQLEKHLKDLTTVDHALTTLQGEVDVKTQAIVNLYAPRVDPLTKRRAALVDEITKLFEANREVLLADGKTIVTRAGTLSASFGKEAINIDDEAAAMAYARKQGMLKRVTKVGKRTFVKEWLKKFPDFVAKCPGMLLHRTEFLHIKLIKTRVEIKRDLTPYRRALEDR
jgi:phage host-nuclease inhibitor protein Gam